MVSRVIAADCESFVKSPVGTAWFVSRKDSVSETDPCAIAGATPYMSNSPCRIVAVFQWRQRTRPSFSLPTSYFLVPTSYFLLPTSYLSFHLALRTSHLALSYCPACVTATDLSPMVSVPDRGDGSVLASMWMPTSPSPLPLAPLVTVIHGTSLDAVQGQVELDAFT